MQRIAGFLAAMLLTVPSVAQAQPATATTRRAHELLPILNGAGTPRRTFAKPFFAEVPEPKLRQALAGVSAQLGKAQRIASVEPLEGHRAELVIAYERGTAHAILAVEPGGSGRVIGFLIDRIIPADIAAMRSLDDIAAAVAELPGAASFAVADIDAAPLAGLEPGRPLAIASTAKLVILAELVRAIDAGERKWTDTIARGTRELPAGGFNQLAPDARLTLRKLAEEMIRTSDNSATDLLLFELGRARVEGMLGPVGFAYADANVPFLSTMELFKLKGIDGGALGRRYLAASPDARRRMLAGEVAQAPGSAITRYDAKPVLVGEVEWFATPMDLVRAMGWFTRHADTSAGAEALRILALNPGPAQPLRERFGYVGYKGGSEPGVMSMTVLLRDRVARWKVVTATWNDPAAAVDDVWFAALITRALEIVAGPSTSSG
jgi:hypothetical protein